MPLRRPQTALAESSLRESSTAGAAGQKGRAGSMANTTSASHVSSVSASESTKVLTAYLLILVTVTVLLFQYYCWQS